MRKTWGLVWVAILGLMLTLGTGCETQQERLLREEIDHLNQVNMNYEKEVRELMSQMEALRVASMQKDTEVDGLQRQVELLRDRLAKMPTRDPLSEKQRRMLLAIARETGGELVGNRILLPGDFLFASGSWALKPSAQRTLKQISAVLDPEQQRLVLMLVGHTDNEPIKKLRKKNITSNRQLSLMRSLAVLNYLDKHASYPADLMYPTGWGELKPVASNKTASGRARNRRVEIYIDPILSNLTATSAIEGISTAEGGGMDYVPAAPEGNDATISIDGKRSPFEK